jgi:serine/threonine protein kinase
VRRSSLFQIKHLVKLNVKKQRALNEVNMLCVACGNENAVHSKFCPHDQTTLIHNADKRLGAVLCGRYEIIEIIKSGGMGTVYKARQLLMNRIVAIKMLHISMLANAGALKRFRLEAQAVSRLGMPNILTIYDFGLTPEGQPYMVMPYLDGVSLDEVMATDHRINAMRVLDISIQVCAALSHAHSHGVLHRDIKPSNIMLINDDGRFDFVKIVDFGIAKIMNAIDNSSCIITKTGELSGSPAYMSPEQCYGTELDARSDIYSLGCVMYTTLTGHNFFDSHGLLQTMEKHINDVPPALSDWCPEIEFPHDLECAVLKALAKSPGERFQTMNHFQEHLQEIHQRLIASKTRSDHSITTKCGSSVVGQLSPPALGEIAAVNKVTAPLPDKRMSVHSSKMTVASLALASSAVLTMLTFTLYRSNNEAEKSMVQFKQPHIFAASSSALREDTAVEHTDIVGKRPSPVNAVHTAAVGRNNNNRVKSRNAHVSTAPTYRYQSRENHRHAYSSY